MRRKGNDFKIYEMFLNKFNQIPCKHLRHIENKVKNTAIFLKKYINYFI
jgi:hypothetical protein